jgi:Putative mono-oxygenase ydhR
VEDLSMITAIVRFKLPATVDAAKAAELFRGSAPKYQGLAGLIRKYYLFDAETGTGGGCYLWESREAADRVYTAEWLEMITERYGAAPEISYFETPVIVDNTLVKTILDAAE